jgi:hypothetical protein
MAANNQARIDWIANYNCDDPDINCPAPGDTAVYYFIAYAAASPNDTITSPLLSVKPKRKSGLRANLHHGNAIGVRQAEKSYFCQTAVCLTPIALKR